MSGSTPTHPVSPGDVLAGKYEVERVLGEGGMGVVVAARHRQLGERVALKFLLPHVVGDEQNVARFLREAQAAVRIKSPHVARVIDVGTLENGSPYMVMEHLEGRDLAALLHARGRLPPVEAMGYVLQACEAIAEAHSHGIVHRDIKPGNLFVTQSPDGRPFVKVLDFGISKVTTPGANHLTRTQHVMGSPLYMSPEQMRSAKAAGPAADQWALGVTLYEMVVGEVPFDADTMPELCAKVLEQHAPRVRDFDDALPEGLDAIVARCLSRAPDERFASIAQLAQALAREIATPEAHLAAERCDRVLAKSGSGAAPAGDMRQLPSALATTEVNPPLPLSERSPSGAAIEGANAAARAVTGASTAAPASVTAPPLAPPPGRRGVVLSLVALGALGLIAFVALGRSSADAPHDAPRRDGAQGAQPAPSAPPRALVAASEAPTANHAASATTTGSPAPASPDASAPAPSSSTPTPAAPRPRPTSRPAANEGVFDQRK